MKGIRIGRIFGIEINFHWSLLLLVGLFGWSFSSYFINLAGIDPTLSLLWGFISAFGLLASIVIHELAHSLVAKRYKVYIRKITLFIFGGMAHLEGQPPSARAEFWFTLAGPVSSFVLVGIFWLLAYLFSLLGSKNLWIISLIRSFSLLSFINLILGGFNLFIPGFPLDGGRILRALLWRKWGSIEKATKWASKIGQGVACFFMAVGFFQFILGNVGGLWLAIIGFILYGAAKAEYLNLITKGVLGKTKTEEILTRFEQPMPRQSLPPGAVTCEKEESLTTLLEKMKQSSDRLIFVVEDNRVLGTITQEQILKIIGEKIKK